jgi:hypothetical protein
MIVVLNLFQLSLTGVRLRVAEILENRHRRAQGFLGSFQVIHLLLSLGKAVQCFSLTISVAYLTLNPQCLMESLCSVF